MSLHNNQEILNRVADGNTIAWMMDKERERNSQEEEMAEPKLLRVTMEFEDRTQVLEGKQAEMWLEAVNNQAMISHVHGLKFPKFDWDITLM